MGCLAPNQMNSNCLLLGHTIGFVSLKKIQCQHCFTLLATAWAMDSQPFNLERALRGFLLALDVVELLVLVHRNSFWDPLLSTMYH